MEVVVEEDASTGIDGRGMLVMNKVSGHEFFFGVSKNAFHISFRCFLQGAKNFFLGGGFFGSESQIDN